MLYLVEESRIPQRLTGLAACEFLCAVVSDSIDHDAKTFTCDEVTTIHLCLLHSSSTSSGLSFSTFLSFFSSFLMSLAPFFGCHFLQ